VDELTGMIRRSPTHRNWRDPATIRLWAHALGIPEAELIEAIAIAGPSVEGVLLYLHAPD
jgi:uncharacterized protein DUF3606